MKSIANQLGIFAAALLLVALIAILLAYPTMLLWNGCLEPAVDGVNKIGLLQALGLNVLASILFKSYSQSKK